jgi:hypothetical protein
VANVLIRFFGRFWRLFGENIGDFCGPMLWLVLIHNFFILNKNLARFSPLFCRNFFFNVEPNNADLRSLDHSLIKGKPDNPSYHHHNPITIHAIILDTRAKVYY